MCDSEVSELNLPRVNKWLDGVEPPTSQAFFFSMRHCKRKQNTQIVLCQRDLTSSSRTLFAYFRVRVTQ